MAGTDALERWRNDLRPILVELDRLTAQVKALSPPPWPELDPREDPDEPAIIRKERRRRRRGEP